MSESSEAGSEVFGPDDLEPAVWEKKAAKQAGRDKVLTIVACCALGTWGGGMTALGVCAAPMVFRLAPAPFNGYAMGAAFERFDAIAVACALCVLACEAGRTLVSWGGPQRKLDRVRRYAAILLALAAVFSATALSPRINAMYRAGVRRGIEPGGAALEKLHKQAEAVSKGVVPMAFFLLGLHILTLRSRHDFELEAAEQDLGPAAPGPKNESQP
jgi:hypothetical protein